jgi:hypothetical protein
MGRHLLAQALRAIDKTFTARYHFKDLRDVVKADALVGSS